MLNEFFIALTLTTGILLVAVAVLRRRKRVANRLLTLGTVSQQWLLIHKSEQR